MDPVILPSTDLESSLSSVLRQAENTDPNRLLSTDIQSSLSSVLRRHNHPLVLAGPNGNRWMGSNGCALDGLDIVVRSHYLPAILKDLEKTGDWAAVDASPVDEWLYHPENLFPEAEAVMEWLPDTDCYSHVLFWSEESYHLKIDPEAFFKAPYFCAKRPTLLQEEYHPTSNRTDDWWYGPETPSRLGQNMPKPPDALDADAILIPDIITYLNALSFQATHYQSSKPTLAFLAKWQIRNMVRYLYLELPHQANCILISVDMDTESFLEPYFKNYVRKPYYVLSDNGEFVPVKVWDPQSFPLKFATRLVPVDLRPRFNLIRGMASIAHSSRHWTEDVGVTASPEAINFFLEAVITGCTKFKIGPCELIEFESRSGINIPMELLQLGGPFVESISTVKPLFGGFVASPMDLVLLRAMEVAGRGNDGDVADWRWLLGLVAERGQILPEMDKEMIEILVEAAERLSRVERILFSALLSPTTWQEASL